jgi:hypothetical protein
MFEAAATLRQLNEGFKVVTDQHLHGLRTILDLRAERDKLQERVKELITDLQGAEALAEQYLQQSNTTFDELTVANATIGRLTERVKELEHEAGAWDRAKRLSYENKMRDLGAPIKADTGRDG